MATLTFNFTVGSPAPVGGYRLYYRQISSNAAYTEVSVMAPPHVVSGAADGVDYEGYAVGDCDGLDSPKVHFMTEDHVLADRRYMRLWNDLGTICAQPKTLVYFDPIFPNPAITTILYYDFARINEITGFNYAMTVDGLLCQLDPANGMVISTSLVTPC